MIDDFVAIVLFEKVPSLDAATLETAMRDLEPAMSVKVRSAARPGTLLIAAGVVEAACSACSGQMPEEATVSSLGMADLEEAERNRLLAHGAHVILECTATSPGAPIDKMILLLKVGMALCSQGGWAVCIPACGLCLTEADLHSLAETDHQGPRAWAVDDAEAELGSYETLSLWESLRRDAQPANLLVGFVPAEVEGKTWFFSGGHSLFNLPELVFTDGTIDDFEAVREYFRFLFPYFYNNPQAVGGGENVRIDETLSFQLEELPERYAELQSSTGTLRVRLVETSGRDTDWD